MKATSLLESQHRKVESLLKQLESGVADHEALREELANQLAAHMAIEQDIFYPAIKRVNDDLVNESYEEHALAEVALKRLLATAPEDDEFRARVIALKDLIQHHVQEEEEELFPAVQGALDKETLEQLGQTMQQRFEAVYAAGYASAVPIGWATTSADISKQLAAKQLASQPLASKETATQGRPKKGSQRPKASRSAA